jgi:succinate dehydrogenase / fumarate reductase iron-sulfur subunit
LFINGRPHGPSRHITTCQLHMRKFKDGDTIHVEPWRSGISDNQRSCRGPQRVRPHPSRRWFCEREHQRQPGGRQRHAHSQTDADKAFDAATCIGCGACVAACPNSSAMLFVAAKVSQYALLPQGRPEAKERALNMVEQMDKEGFGNCSNIGACEIECPKGHLAGEHRTVEQGVFGSERGEGVTLVISPASTPASALTPAPASAA